MTHKFYSGPKFHYSKIARGMLKLTSQFGMSTISLIRKSPATLHSM